MNQAFNHHDTRSPDTAETSALGYGQPSLNPPSAAFHQTSDYRHNASNTNIDVGAQLVPMPRINRAAASEILALLPAPEVANILVETYFDKVHWFMLLFHQLQFRNSVKELYQQEPSENGIHGTVTAHQNTKNVGFASAFLAVCALSLRLVSTDSRQQLANHGVDSDELREHILTTLKLRMLEIIAIGSLEAVQMCVLLGSYYMYHGEPGLAWPLCGCALRLAQALELHRSSRPDAGSVASTEVIEARKRCWWALHEIETFSSMIYGFPQSISDADCDVEPLNLHDLWSLAADTGATSQGQITLLEYKSAMVRLTGIIKTTLGELYGTRRAPPSTSRVRYLIVTIDALSTKLDDWHGKLPEKLLIRRFADIANQDSVATRDMALSFEEQLFQLQALVLKLAFENTRILIHRPLLSYKTKLAPQATEARRSLQDPFAQSIQACRDAALEISWASHASIFTTASTTYAMSFVSLHLLTAGVTLCIMASLDPLGPECHMWKMGVRRLMAMLLGMERRTILAAQGVEILKKLLRLVMEKETEMMLSVDPVFKGSTSVGSPSYEISLTQDEHVGSSNSFAVDGTGVGDLSLPFDIYEDQSMIDALHNVEQGTFPSLPRPKSTIDD